MSQFRDLLLYELRKKYPDAAPDSDTWHINIPYRRVKAAVSLYVSVSMDDAGKTRSYSYISFDFHNKQKNRDNQFYLHDVIDVSQPITPVAVEKVASACLKRIAPLYKRVKAELDAQAEREQRRRLAQIETVTRIRGEVEPGIIVTADPETTSSVNLRYGNFNRTVYAYEPVTLKVPLNKLKSVLDVLGHGPKPKQPEALPQEVVTV